MTQTLRSVVPSRCSRRCSESEARCLRTEALCPVSQCDATTARDKDQLRMRACWSMRGCCMAVILCAYSGCAHWSPHVETTEASLQAVPAPIAQSSMTRPSGGDPGTLPALAIPPQTICTFTQHEPTTLFSPARYDVGPPQLTPHSVFVAAGQMVSMAPVFVPSELPFDSLVAALPLLSEVVPFQAGSSQFASPANFVRPLNMNETQWNMVADFPPPIIRQPGPMPLPVPGMLTRRPGLFESLTVPSYRLDSLPMRVTRDYRHFYSPWNLTLLALETGKSAILANTRIDQEFHNWYQKRVRTSGTDEVSRFIEPIGNGYYVVPAVLAAWALGPFIDGGVEGGVTEWGERSSRTMLVGGPALLAMQFATGGSRPGETSHDSYWRPFEDTNGASGHAFMGAVPFLSLAHMTDNAWHRAGWYAASTLVAWSRVNDGSHYISQAGLGWALAFLAARSVDQSSVFERRLQFFPFPVNNGIGLAAQWEY